VTVSALSQHISTAAAYERPDVPHLAEEHVPDEVVPEPDRHLVLSQQTLIADQNVVLREFGTKRRSDRNIESNISKLGVATLVLQI